MRRRRERAYTARTIGPAFSLEKRSAWAAFLLLFLFLAFVSQIDQKGNKRGIKGTNACAPICLRA